MELEVPPYYCSPRLAGTDHAMIKKIRRAYYTFKINDSCNSFLKEVLNHYVYHAYKHKRTVYGGSFWDVIQAGATYINEPFGIFAPDPDAYTVFRPLFNVVIDEMHLGFTRHDKQPHHNWGAYLEKIRTPDPTNQFIESTRIRLCRNLEGYPFASRLTRGLLKEIEEKIKPAFKEMPGGLDGRYFSLEKIRDEIQDEMRQEHVLWFRANKYLQTAHVGRFWPTGRGIYMNKARSFIVWVNKDDHLRIISTNKGNDIQDVYQRLVKGTMVLERNLSFAHDERLGYLTFDPANLGTTLRASYLIRLPRLRDAGLVETLAERFDLEVRGTHGARRPVIRDGLYNISNKRRLGLTEYEAVMALQIGISKLIYEEQKLQRDTHIRVLEVATRVSGGSYKSITIGSLSSKRKRRDLESRRKGKEMSHDTILEEVEVCSPPSSPPMSSIIHTTPRVQSEISDDDFSVESHLSETTEDEDRKSETTVSSDSKSKSNIRKDKSMSSKGGISSYEIMKSINLISSDEHIKTSIHHPSKEVIESKSGASSKEDVKSKSRSSSKENVKSESRSSSKENVKSKTPRSSKESVKMKKSTSLIKLIKSKIQTRSKESKSPISPKGVGKSKCPIGSKGLKKLKVPIGSNVPVKPASQKSSKELIDSKTEICSKEDVKLKTPRSSNEIVKTRSEKHSKELITQKSLTTSKKILKVKCSKGSKDFGKSSKVSIGSKESAKSCRQCSSKELKKAKSGISSKEDVKSKSLMSSNDLLKSSSQHRSNKTNKPKRRTNSNETMKSKNRHSSAKRSKSKGRSDSHECVGVMSRNHSDEPSTRNSTDGSIKSNNKSSGTKKSNADSLASVTTSNTSSMNSAISMKEVKEHLFQFKPMDSSFTEGTSEEPSFATTASVSTKEEYHNIFQFKPMMSSYTEGASEDSPSSSTASACTKEVSQPSFRFESMKPSCAESTSDGTSSDTASVSSAPSVSKGARRKEKSAKVKVDKAEKMRRKKDSESEDSRRASSGDSKKKSSKELRSKSKKGKEDDEDKESDVSASSSQPSSSESKGTNSQVGGVSLRPTHKFMEGRSDTSCTSVDSASSSVEMRKRNKLNLSKKIQQIRDIEF